MKPIPPDLAAGWAIALAARVAMALIVDTPTVLGDEVEYFLAARRPEGHPGLCSLAYPPLYPAFLRMAAVAFSSETGYLLCRMLNALVSSTIVPLTYPLWSPAGLWGGCLVGLLPAGVITSGVLLSENLFAPLLALWLWTAAWWSQRPTGARAALMGAVASCTALTRAAGGAVILATLGFMIIRRTRFSQACAALAALTPVVVFLLIGHPSPPHPFNDPLALGHPHEITRALILDLDDLTRDTVLAQVAQRLPWPWLFAAAWMAYWGLQYALYILIGTAGFAFVDRAQCGRRSASSAMLLPVVLVSAFGVALAANHTLAGVQAEQFVRGRYVEPIVPLWAALGVGCAATRGKIALPWKALPWCCLVGIIALTAPQNRATDFLYPLRSIVLRTGPWTGTLVRAGAAAMLFVALRAVGSRPGAWRLAAVGFLVISLPASMLRFRLQHDEARRQAVPARWLAAHDPDASVQIRTDNRAPDSLKADGLTWAAQQIRFFSRNQLSLAPDPSARYALHSAGEGIVCSPLGRRGKAICLSRTGPQ